VFAWEWCRGACAAVARVAPGGRWQRRRPLLMDQGDPSDHGFLFFLKSRRDFRGCDLAEGGREGGVRSVKANC
jgi:hypothetical protein